MGISLASFFRVPTSGFAIPHPPSVPHASPCQSLGDAPHFPFPIFSAAQPSLFCCLTRDFLFSNLLLCLFLSLCFSLCSYPFSLSPSASYQFIHWLSTLLFLSLFPIPSSLCMSFCHPSLYSQSFSNPLSDFSLPIVQALHPVPLPHICPIFCS